MVFIFDSCTTTGYKIYIGKDKFENDEMIKYGWPEDVWFHVKDLSSAHVYLRLNTAETYNDIPKQLIEECASLCKANSTEGCKKLEVDVNYTMWSNLEKSKTMKPGEVGFKDLSLVNTLKSVTKNTVMVKKINETRREARVDFKTAREDRNEEDKHQRIAYHKAVERAKLKEESRRQLKQKKKSYEHVFNPKRMRSNENPVAEEDFM